MKLKLQLLIGTALFSVLLITTTTLFAASPANLSTNIHWTDSGGVYDSSSGIFDANFATVADVEMAFNNARRQEEIQLSLPANTLGSLNLPGNFLTQSDDDRALFLINEERTARAGMAAGVIGLPLQSLQTDIDAIAQGHADYLVANNIGGHTGAGGTSPFDRIDNDPNIGLAACAGANGHEFLPRAENIASFWTSGSSNAMYIERAIYTWLYADAGSSWGHREAVLLQDDSLSSSGGFSNNYGAATSEGFLGIGVKEATAYNPYGFAWSNFGTVVVMNIFDPVADSIAGDCTYGNIVPTAVSLLNSDTTAQTLLFTLAGLTSVLLLISGIVVKRSVD